MIHHESHPDTHAGTYSKTVFGFWIYLLTDFMMFGTFFAAYAVLRNGTFGGPTGQQLFRIPFHLLQTVVLLLAAALSGIGGACAHRKNKSGVIFSFLFVFLAGTFFLWTEYHQLHGLVLAGAGPGRSAFLSAFFTIIGIHGFHTFFALLWIPVLIVPVLIDGLNDIRLKRITCLKMFWQFLNIVWIFIFSFIYLIGARGYD